MISSSITVGQHSRVKAKFQNKSPPLPTDELMSSSVTPVDTYVKYPIRLTEPVFEGFIPLLLKISF